MEGDGGVFPRQRRDGEDHASILALPNRSGGEADIGCSAGPVLQNGGGEAAGLLDRGLGGAVGLDCRPDGGTVFRRVRGGDGAVFFRLHHGLGAVGPPGGLRHRSGDFVGIGGGGGPVGVFHRGGSAGRTPAGRGPTAGGPATGGGNGFPEQLIAADGAGFVPGPVLGGGGGPVYHPVPGGVGGVAVLLAVVRNGTAGDGTAVPVVGSAGLPDRAPDVGMSGGRPGGVEAHVFGGHLENGFRVLRVAQDHALGFPGGEGKAALAARADGDRGSCLVGIGPRGGSAVLGVADRHLVFGSAGLFRGGDFDGVCGRMALVGNGEGLACRRLGGVKAVDHARRHRNGLRCPVEIRYLNGQVRHVQSFAYPVLGLVGGAADGNPRHRRHAGGRNGDGGVGSRLMGRGFLHAHVVNPGGKAGGLGSAAGLRACEISVRGILHFSGGSGDLAVQTSGGGGGDSRQPGGGGGTIGPGDAPLDGFWSICAVIPLVTGLQSGGGCVLAHAGGLVGPGEGVARSRLHTGLLRARPLQPGVRFRDGNGIGAGVRRSAAVRDGQGGIFEKRFSSCSIFFGYDNPNGICVG